MNMEFKKHALNSWSKLAIEEKGLDGTGDSKLHLSTPTNSVLKSLNLITDHKIKVEFSKESLEKYKKLIFSDLYFNFLNEKYVYKLGKKRFRNIEPKDYQDPFNSILSLSTAYDAEIKNQKQGVYLGIPNLLNKLNQICPSLISGIILTKGQGNDVYNLEVYFDEEIVTKYSIDSDKVVGDDIEENHFKNPSNQASLIPDFHEITKKAGLIFDVQLIQRFVASLYTKPFVICSGLSGSGKTKLAQAFVQWICASEKQYKIIPVGADWTNREPLLGYPNGLDPKSYVTPDSGSLQLILEASKDIHKPYFMILDEMNLSHVERYFADFLSVMESGDSIKLYSGENRYSNYKDKSTPDEKDFIPHEIKWPKNLFIIGTVNIDETTYMFSPKVLDRANVIEFRISPADMTNFFKKRQNLNMDKFYLDENKTNGGLGKNMGESFLAEAQNKIIITSKSVTQEILTEFFIELQKVGSEFGYRSATEIELLITKLSNADFTDKERNPLHENSKIDIAIMQKLLPKLHGSRKKLVNPLETLAGFCLSRINNSQPEDQHKNKKIYQQFISEERNLEKWQIKYSISFEKIERMLKNLIDNGFTSYAEA
jgi:5-methylcytosine-specific restriction protein B